MAEQVGIQNVLHLTLYNEHAQPVLFQSVLNCQENLAARTNSFSSEDTLSYNDAGTARVLVVFIRHFFCGLCQEYIRRLVVEPRFQTSALRERNTRMIIIGCGAPSLITSYRQITAMPSDWRIFTDPSAESYRALGMYKTYNLGSHTPHYIQRSTMRNMVKSVAQVVRRLPNADVFAAGDFDVQGGEFLLEKSFESWNLVWQHRMRNSRDHTEVDELARVLLLPLDAEIIPTKSMTNHRRVLSHPVIGNNEQLPEPDSNQSRRFQVGPLHRIVSLRHMQSRPITLILDR